MSSKLARTPVVSLSAMFALVALAFSSGCALDDESLDDVEAVREPSITMHPVNPATLKPECEDRLLVWEDNTCRKGCNEGYVLVRGECTSKRLVEPSRKLPGEAREPTEEPTEEPPGPNGEMHWPTSPGEDPEKPEV